MRRCCLVALLVFGILAGVRAAACAESLSVIEYGARVDHHGQVLADGLDPRNTPSTLAVTADGAIWFRENFSWHPRIARFAADGTFREYRDPYTSDPYTTVSTNPCDFVDACVLAFGPSGFSPLIAAGNDVLIGPIQKNPYRIVELSASGMATAHPAAGCLAAGPDFACFPHSTITIEFDPKFQDFRSTAARWVPVPSVTPDSAVLGPDGNIWFTDARNSQLGRIHPDGRYETFSDGLTRWDSGPQFITVGPDGNLWFTEQRDRIGRITLDGRITEFPRGIPHRASLGGIVAGPDGALWFTLYHGMDLGRISLDGRVRIYHGLVYPSDGHDFDPVAMIVRDEAGRLYYNEGQAGRIARLTIRP